MLMSEVSPTPDIIVIPERGPVDIEVAESIRRHTADPVAANTKRAYRSDWRAFTSWCAEHGFDPLPAKPEAVAGYISNLADLELSWATIVRHLATIASAHHMAELPSPTDHPLVRVAYKSIQRELGVSQHRVKPLLPEQLARWLPLLPDGARGLRDAALLTMGVGGAFRRSELASLRIEDVEVVDQGLLVRLKRSKTDQEGAGRQVGIWFGSQAVTCPVRRWRAWLERRGDAEPEEPAFTSVLGDQVTDRPIAGRTVARAVKRLVELGGEDPGDYSGHSLRAGFVTAADKAGVAEGDIMRQTGHKSRATLDRYVRPSTIWDKNASRSIGL